MLGLATLALAALAAARPTPRALKAAQAARGLEKRGTAPALVFAHFMIGNTGSYTSADQYQTEMQEAMNVGIDGFALNLANEDYDDTQLNYAYTAAQAIGFKCMISFDFGAYSAFSSDYATTIIPRLQTYASHPAAATYNNNPLVSTFVGDGFDWAPVRSGVSGVTLVIVPSYSPTALSGVNVDGGFQWNSWPTSDNNPIDSNMTTDGDTYYQQQITADGESIYMAGVSPWFFTHLNDANVQKNYLYLSDTLLVDRWNEMSTVQPQLIEIITWNDFGESSYIGPLHPDNTDVYYPGGASPGAIDYVTGMPHEAWLDVAKVFIAWAKAGYDDVSSHVDTEEIVYWYRPFSKTLTCSDALGPPTGSDYPQDAVFAATVLKTEATLTITAGGVTSTYDAPAGITVFASDAFGGTPSFSLDRSGTNVVQGDGGLAIATSCTENNYNAFVGSIVPSS